MKILLAIDDDPCRYDHLARLLRKHDILTVTVQNPDGAEQVIESGLVFAVMLDHDMQTWEGTYYAEHVSPNKKLPVCISSANREGAANIAKILQANNIHYTVFSATETQPDYIWLGWVLDLAYSKNL